MIIHRIALWPVQPEHAVDAESGCLTCVQNVIEGRGWRLDVLDLAKAVTAGDADAVGVRVRSHTFTPHDELEGYWPLGRERSILAVAHRHDNIMIGVIKPVEQRPSLPGTP